MLECTKLVLLVENVVDATVRRMQPWSRVAEVDGSLLLYFVLLFGPNVRLLKFVVS